MFTATSLLSVVRYLILLNLLLFFSSCGTVKDAFSNQKKNSSDEFLVEKKSPLVMPPDYNELPTPKTNNDDQVIEENKIQELLSNNENNVSENNNQKTPNLNLENSILDKIKKN